MLLKQMITQTTKETKMKMYFISLLGLLVACGDKEEDTAVDTAEEVVEEVEEGDEDSGSEDPEEGAE